MTPRRLIPVFVAASMLMPMLPAGAATSRTLPAPVDRGDRVGAGVAVSGAWAAAGAPGDGAGVVHLFRWVSGAWRWRQQIAAPGGRAGDGFGETVAMHGGRMVVGATGDDTRRGSASFFRLARSRWVFVNKVVGSQRAVDDSFGNDIAIWRDRAIIGAWHHGGKAFYETDYTGAAYVFELKGRRWKEVKRLEPADAQPEDGFGTSVAIEGSRILVGAWHQDERSWNAGAVYVYARDGGLWGQRDKLIAPDTQSTDHFGIAVDISGDTLLIGAWDNDQAAFNAGASYFYVRAASVEQGQVGPPAEPWLLQAKVVAQDPGPKDLFGTSVALDGDRAVIGAYGDDIRGNNSGSAYVFVRAGVSWTQQGRLLPPNGSKGAHTGTSVAIDGRHVLAGADLSDLLGEKSGAAFVTRLAS